MKKILNSKNINFLLLILIGTFILFRPPMDPDFGWHYKYGEYLFKNGKILKENIFSYTNQNYDWVSSYWITQLVIYVSHHFLGNVIPTIISSAALSLLILFILNKNSKDFFSVSFVFILTIISISKFGVTTRPLYFSTIFLLLLTNTLLKENGNKKLLPILFFLWANMHADFIIGLFILGIYCLSVFFKTTGAPTLPLKEIFSPWKNKKNIYNYLKSYKSYLTTLVKNNKTLSIFTESFSILFISTAVTLINPYGIKLWEVLLKELTQPIKAFVGEWNPVMNISFSNIFFSATASLGLVLSLSPYKKEDNSKTWYKFLIVFFYLLGVKSVYFFRIVYIISMFLVLENIQNIKMDILKIHKSFLQQLSSLIPTFSLIFILSAFSNPFIKNVFLSLNTKDWSIENKYPYKAISYIKTNPIEGNMLNDYSWGGYLIWQLPEYKTFIDGRMTAWKVNGEYLMEEYRQINYAPEENTVILEKIFKDFDVKWVINGPNSKIIKYLKEKRPDEWGVYYEDEISVVLIKE